MSYTSFLALCVIDFLAVTGVHGNCILPPQTQDIDWSNMTGNWFEVLNHLTDVDNSYPCALTTDIQPAEDGFTCTTVLYNPSTKSVITIPDHIYKTQDGGYSEHYNPAAVPSVARNIIVKMGIGIRGYNGAVKTSTMSLYTDYENYFMGITCGIIDQPNLWIVSLNPNKPNEENMQKIRNKLIEIGNGWEGISLNQRHCPDTHFLSHH